MGCIADLFAAPKGFLGDVVARDLGYEPNADQPEFNTDYDYPSGTSSSNPAWGVLNAIGVLNGSRLAGLKNVTLRRLARESGLWGGTGAASEASILSTIGLPFDGSF